MIEAIKFKNSRSSRDGVVITSLSEWAYPSETWATWARVITADDAITQEAVAFARSKLGQGYDSDFMQSKVNQPNYYCSESVWAAFYKASKGRIDLVLIK